MNIQLRNPAEIQAAHDRIVAILTDEVPNPFRDKHNLGIAADVLCWVLQHKHNESFQGTLDYIDVALQQQGYELTDTGTLQVPLKKPQ